MTKKTTLTIAEKLHLYNKHLPWLNSPLRSHEQIKIDRTILENDFEYIFKSDTNDPCWKVFSLVCEKLTIDDERWDALDKTYP